MSKKKRQQEAEDGHKIKTQLLSILAREVIANSITEQDRLLLSLRLGLIGDRCYTLAETGRALHRSTESVRQRQYLLLRRKIANPLFFTLLKTYALSHRLPPGFDIEMLDDIDDL